jgi:polysaccharide export outer membrane protein
MKKLLSFGGLGIFLLLIMTNMAYPQADREILSRKEAQAEVAADSDRYVIGAEDVLYIHIWREETLTKTVNVRMDGRISMPLVDDIQAAGITPLRLKELLTQRFKEFIENPNITVMVMEANSFRVYISGEVKNPGVYRLRTETSIVQFIPMAGGFTEWARRNKIIIVRKENGREKRMKVNYKKIVQGGDLDSNVMLRPGDTIIVP